MNDLSGLSDDDLKEYADLVCDGRIFPVPGESYLDSYLKHKGMGGDL